MLKSRVEVLRLISDDRFGAESSLDSSWRSIGRISDLSETECHQLQSAQRLPEHLSTAIIGAAENMFGKLVFVYCGYIVATLEAERELAQGEVEEWPDDWGVHCQYIDDNYNDYESRYGSSSPTNSPIILWDMGALLLDAGVLSETCRQRDPTMNIIGHQLPLIPQGT